VAKKVLSTPASGGKEVMKGKETSGSMNADGKTVSWRERGMKKLSKCCKVLLLGAVLMTTLVGVAGARPNGRPLAAVSRRITIPPGHFIPAHDGVAWANYGHYLRSASSAVDEHLYAPVVFPTWQAVVVESITLYAYDNNTWDGMCVQLYRTDPTSGNEVTMGYVCSTSYSTTNPRSFTDSTIFNNPVKHGKGVYVRLTSGDASNLRFYAVRIQYHHGTT
jgi:hypothetical protein